MVLSESINRLQVRSNFDGFLRRLLEKEKIFSSFYYLSELRSREDLIKGIVENLDYSVYILSCLLFDHDLIYVYRDGHARIVLSKALTSTYKVGFS